MSRNPWALHALVDEALTITHPVEWTRVNEPDGLGVFRSFSFDDQTSEWLLPALQLLEDKRVSSVEDGVVSFIHTPDADSRRDFGLREALDALNQAIPDMMDEIGTPESTDTLDEPEAEKNDGPEIDAEPVVEPALSRSKARSAKATQ